MADFINNPKIFGISLNDDDQQAKNKNAESKENKMVSEKTEEAKKDN